MELKFREEDRVCITLKNGLSYEGNVKNYSATYQRISLKNIVEHPRKVIIEGLRHFDCSEIAQMEIVHLPDSTINDETSSNKHNPHKSIHSATRKILESDYNNIICLQNSFCFIGDCMADFDSAISKLEKSDAIGVYGKNTTKGRAERASIIVLSTSSNIFIFDLTVLGDKVFDKGLRKILQAESIIKVVYDCRLLTDCLFHKHQVKLVNVRDVEAEDIMIVHQERGYIRKHNRSFGYLIETYLGIPRDVVSENDLTESWKERPLNTAQIKSLAAFASFLIPVHEAIEKHFLQRLIDASNIYNEYLRDSDMYAFVTEDCGYVFRRQLIELTKYKNTCRGNK